MMNATMAVNGPWNFLAFGLAFHVLSFLILLSAILFVVWMIKFAKKEELKSWIVWLFAIGIIGCVLMGAFVAGLQRWESKRNMINFGNVMGVPAPETTDSPYIPEMMEVGEQN